MIPPLIERHLASCNQCAQDIQKITSLGQKTAMLISAHGRLKDQYLAIPRQDLPAKAAITLIQAARDVETSLNNLEPLERSKAVRLAYCLFAETKAKL